MTSPDRDGRRILIVDDEEAVLFALQDVLEQSGTEVDGVTTEEDAIALLNERHYLVVIADLRLTGAGGKEGFTVVREAKRIDPTVKTIIVTAYGGAETRAQVLESHADCYLEKPVSTQQLHSILTSFGAY